ncbi:pyrroline-5-carboxylate reductase [Ectothiorhodospira haloalkaliphila]|uniref:Pyrroline-5-carboxylate reductase n=1 Tax=Ectothiorhodospira haloalkaliphila TaxID=421628 RepID=W8KXF2_9GAMM|nr:MULTISPECIES: pyrroline-5-carboxylate reductase [Ectothiorhodospira]AHK80211.1 pyrroline-5-carboxylate reductase [Ectothiorhodospira haloalkaliphila]MCG5494584.1 pyrroline-5-carboxylate reductase [Ectothiorhodospira variabilis]MCG5496184.1 pyrroline-5-carboxylate reductase [Ectothiorhodospira variabilis]MCG5503575.1 pyrroline-5-carboxylate reductase [Ectothiorhodospira variabilis]MCG5506710.1 pyrroline-5-carboxylate reductase [Ectothiorhodospira variabilis]
MNETIAFIGAGNMARSLIGGLIADGWNQDAIWAADPNPDQRDAVSQRWPDVHATDDNAAAIAHAQVLVLAVKPQVLGEVCRSVATQVQERHPLVVSIAAGVRGADIERWLGGNLPVVRCMPNTPALVGSGATGLAANPHVSDEQRDVAESILRAVGLTVWLEDEAQLDAVTALSGSGPAYCFLFIEALEDAAVELGLPRDTARLLALQTAFGAAKLALESDEDAATLRTRVTSKGGTTEQALAQLESGGLRELMLRALTAARDRSHALADQLGRD